VGCGWPDGGRNEKRMKEVPNHTTEDTATATTGEGNINKNLYEKEEIEQGAEKAGNRATRRGRNGLLRRQTLP